MIITCPSCNERVGTHTIRDQERINPHGKDIRDQHGKRRSITCKGSKMEAPS